MLYFCVVCYMLNLSKWLFDVVILCRVLHHFVNILCIFFNFIMYSILSLNVLAFVISCGCRNLSSHLMFLFLGVTIFDIILSML
jgi:hypothetical protein